MNELLLEWVDKAERDFATAERELRARKFINYDAVCFHAQQMAEKYLKAFLFKNGVDFPRTHNLRELLELCLPPLSRRFGRKGRSAKGCAFRPSIPLRFALET